MTSGARVAFKKKLQRAAAWLGPVAILAVGLVMLRWSWRTWPDILVDFGRELYVAWQLAAGKTLYTDIAYFNGPLSPYLNSLWFRLFGAGISTLAVLNLALLTLLTAVLYRTLNAASDRLSATVACLTFLTLFAFAQFVGIGNYNFVTPYSHEVTHGLILAMTSIACVAAYARRRGAIWMAGAGFTLGLVFLTKAEMFLAAAVATLGGLTLSLWTERAPPRHVARLILLFTGAALVPPALAWLMLATAMPFEQALEGILRQWTVLLNGDVVSLRFYQVGMGTNDIAGNAGRMVVWFAGYLLLLAPVGVLSLALRKPGPHARVVVAAALFALMAAGVFAAILRGSGLLQAARPLPLIILILAAICTLQFVRQRGPAEERARRILQLALLLFAGTLLAKIILNTRVYQYGFTLAVPGTLVLVIALVGWIPSALDRLGGYGAAFRSAGLGVLLAAVAGHLGVMLYHISQKVETTGTGRDAIRTDAIRGPAVAKVLADIDGRLTPQQTLAVFPEGAMLNYLLRRANPTPYVTFMPPELLIFGEARILDAFRAAPPDIVVLIHKDTSEYGFRYFGRDYGRALFEWIKRHYRPVLLVGQPPLEEGTQFGIEVLEAQRTRMLLHGRQPPVLHPRLQANTGRRLDRHRRSYPTAPELQGGREAS